MGKYAWVAVLILASWFPCSRAMAGIYTDDLTRCLVDSSTPADRETFDVWLFSAESAHAALRPYSNMSEAQREAAAKQAAALFMRLVTVDCRKQAIAAVKNEGRSSYVTAFGVLGETAMTSLMNSPDVNQAMGQMDRFLDRSKLAEIANEAGTAPSAPIVSSPADISSAGARLAISKLSDKDWSTSDADVVVERVVDASSREGLHALAATGDVRAETLEGIGLLLGVAGFPHDEPGATRELQLAAKSDFAPALVMMGFIYQYGLGSLTQDDRMAVSLYQRAADLGDAGGQMCLGDMYAEGRGGLAKDRSKAVELYRRSSRQGDEQAAGKLAALGETP